MSLYQHQPGSVRPDALLAPPESIRESCHLIGSVTSMRSTSAIISSILFTAILNGTCHCRHSRTTSVIDVSCDYPGLHPVLFRDEMPKSSPANHAGAKPLRCPSGLFLNCAAHVCRQRMVDALMSTPHGRRRLEMCEGRVHQAIADRGPEHVWAAGSAPRVMSSDLQAGSPRIGSPEILACLAI